MRIVLSANAAWNLAGFRRPIIDVMRARGDEVICVAPTGPEQFDLEMAGCRFVPIAIDAKGANPLRDGRLMLSYLGVYRRLRPDVALHFTIKPVIYGSLAARCLGVPVVNTITGLGTAFLSGGLLKNVVEGLYRAALRHGSTVFQNADDLGLFRQRRLIAPKDGIAVSGSGIDLAAYRPVALPRSRTTTFLMIGRMLRDKGVLEFVEAARMVGQGDGRARFQLLGPAGVANRSAIAESTLSQWALDGVVEYLGECTDVRPAIAAADCIVLPSYREGMPRVLLEAAAMGRPMIASDVPGCRQVVTDGMEGFLCRPRDAQSLATQFHRFLTLDQSARERMGEAARKKAVACFDAKAVAGTYLDLVNRISAD